ncbi:hypothetical protein ACJRO7_032181 [Eucalyptus globulus]|uniref:RING-type domain-containing protein n=1 Tax=Eucalyptus globulus TaxID=34317 RepID=A0ABD3JK02_EUCGL
MSNYYTRVFAIPTRVPDDDDESLPQPSVILSSHVQSYCSLSKVQGGTGGRICERGFSYRAEHPSTPFWTIVSSMMEGMLLPFPLDRIQWLDMNAGKYAGRTCMTRDELVSEIARVLSREVNDKGRKRTKVMVSMTHVVTVSESEIHESRELNCVICAEEIVMGDQLVRMHCSHEFHQDCIEAWLKIHQTYPLCRCELPAKMS